MRETIRCAVMGLGRLGYWHADNLASKVKGAKLVCVADTVAVQAERTARELGLDRWTKDPESLFTDPDIDALVIATPTGTHAEMAIKAAEHGKHIFVEKPLTRHLEEADAVIEAIREHGVLCQVGFMRRFDPAYAEAKRRIAAGDIGKPVYFKAVSRDPVSPPAQFIKNSGGMFLDMAIHDYDAARFLMGAEACSVAAHGSVLVNEFMERLGDVDQSLTYLTFDSGAAGDIESSRIALYGYDIRAEVIGTEGTIVVGSLRHHDVKILTPKGGLHDIVPAFPERFRDAFQLEMQHYIDCLRSGERPAVTEEDGKAALEIAAAAQLAFETGSKVELSELRRRDTK
ncbi:inositol 2-dehydrogenase [Paenibacillus alkalitolerans]|uniref:inositol 2-dehydrogenase n=1 Tax=Paenibacillus alkalitolerans TaxID=2799335 RepID=UPI0018F2E25E|nr:inositol 2-dehydrogenase [Paenibacillus alkalitolerans]